MVVAEMSGQDAVFRGIEALLGKERRQLMSELGAQQVLNIKERVARREGVSGRAGDIEVRYSASKRAQRDNGQTLVDTGAMMKALGFKGATESEVTVNFWSAWEAKKAIWAQYGTRPHMVAPTTKKALKFRVGAGRGKGAFAFSKGHMVPGTPPRPFFGISRGDLKTLIAHAQKFVNNRIARSTFRG